MTTLEKSAVISTLGLTAIMLAVAIVAYQLHWPFFALALTVGGLGGVMHEIAQSGGKIMFFKKQEDGIYLGSLTGLLLGAIAGFLAIKSYVISASPDEQLAVLQAAAEQLKAVPAAAEQLKIVQAAAEQLKTAMATTVQPMQIVYDAFLAGLALKGVVEAAVGNQVQVTNPPENPPPAK